MRVALIAFIAAMLLTPQASATDTVLLNVPVHISNMRYVTSAHIACGLYADDGAGMPGPRLSFGELDVTPANGMLNETLQISLNVSASHSQAIHYSCALSYDWQGQQPNAVASNQHQGYQRDTGQAVATAVDHVSGVLYVAR